MQLTEGMRVEISTGEGREVGEITRVWNNPADNPYVTVVVPRDGRLSTYVRCSSRVVPAELDAAAGAEFAAHTQAACDIITGA